MVLSLSSGKPPCAPGSAPLVDDWTSSFFPVSSSVSMALQTQSSGSGTIHLPDSRLHKILLSSSSEKMVYLVEKVKGQIPIIFVKYLAFHAYLPVVWFVEFFKQLEVTALPGCAWFSSFNWRAWRVLFRMVCCWAKFSVRLAVCVAEVGFWNLLLCLLFATNRTHFICKKVPQLRCVWYS